MGFSGQFHVSDSFKLSGTIALGAVLTAVTGWTLREKIFPFPYQ
jgi:hypothetical protein